MNLFYLCTYLIDPVTNCFFALLFVLATLAGSNSGNYTVQLTYRLPRFLVSLLLGLQKGNGKELFAENTNGSVDSSIATAKAENDEAVSRDPGDKTGP